MINGRCSNCNHASFTLALGKKKLSGQLLRCCKKCQQIENTDTHEVLKKGRKTDEFREII